MKRCRFLFLLIFLQVACKRENKTPPSSFAANGGSSGDSAQTSNSSALKIDLMDPFVIDNSNDGKQRQFPLVYKFGNNIFVSYSEHPDGVIISPLDAMIISRDNGDSWTEKLTNQDFNITSMFEKNDTLYGIVYYTYPESSLREKMIYWTSADEGRTWVERTGVVNALKNKPFSADGIQGVWGSMLFQRGMRVMTDGSIQGVMYGYLSGDDKYSAVWVESKDNCATWQVVSVIASGVPSAYATGDGYCEPTFAVTKDSSILCVMRMGSNLPLFQSRSTDGGMTWGKPVVLPGLSSTESESVDPQLLLMKSGILALTYGRPGDRIAFAKDGCGYKWDLSFVTYDGQTTGYGGIVETSPGTILLISDQGKAGTDQWAIWGRFIDVN